MKAYLSGGMKNSNWQLKMENECPEIEFINPKRHGLDNPNEYTIWDLEGIKNSDLIFAYLEKDNPSGIGLSLEIGYALGLGKTIILVLEKHEYTDILMFSATICFSNLNDGIKFLKSMKGIYIR